MPATVESAQSQTREEWLELVRSWDGFAEGDGVRISSPTVGLNDNSGVHLVDPAGKVVFQAVFIAANGDLCGVVRDPGDDDGTLRAGYWKAGDEGPIALRGGGESFSVCVRNGFVFGSYHDKRRDFACRWPLAGGLAQEMPMLPFGHTARVLAVNRSGVAVGYAFVLVDRLDERLPCIWKPAADGSYPTIELLSLPEGFTQGIAYDINDAGAIVGGVSDGADPIEGDSKACVWDADGKAEVSLKREGTLRAINDSGDIVGIIGGDQCRFELESESAVNLYPFETPDVPFDLWGIDDSGAGYGTMGKQLASRGDLVGMLLRLVPEAE